MKLGIDVHYGLPVRPKKLDLEVDGNIMTLSELIKEINKSGFGGEIDRFLKIPGADNKVQTIYVNKKNLDYQLLS